MLILTRKRGESLYIGDDIKIIIVEVKGHQVRIGVEAPAHFRIYREEIYLQILEENRKAAEASSVSSEGLEGLSDWKGAKSQGLEPKKGGSLSIMKFGSTEKKGEPTVVVKRKKPKVDDE